MEGELSCPLLYIYVYVTFLLFNSQGRILSLSWHPSGTQIAAGSIDYISVFDVKSGDCFFPSNSGVPKAQALITLLINDL